MTLSESVVSVSESSRDVVSAFRPGELSHPTRTARVMLVISSLRCGGAERVMSTMANYWAASGWHVALVTLDPTSTDFFPVDPRIQRIGLGVS